MTVNEVKGLTKRPDKYRIKAEVIEDCNHCEIKEKTINLSSLKNVSCAVELHE